MPAPQQIAKRDVAIPQRRQQQRAVLARGAPVELTHRHQQIAHMPFVKRVDRTAVRPQMQAPARHGQQRRQFLPGEAAQPLLRRS